MLEDWLGGMGLTGARNARSLRGRRSSATPTKGCDLKRSHHEAAARSDVWMLRLKTTLARLHRS